MSEIPKGNPQFVGQADARNLRAAEAAKPVDVKLSPEQQQLADVMKQSGETLETKVVDARDKAAIQLKELHGKELVDAGLKQMGKGVWETFKSQLKWAVPSAILGSMIGGAAAELGTRKLNSLSGREDVVSRLSMVFDEYIPPMSASDGQEVRAFVTGLGFTGGAYLGGKAGAFVGYETAGLKYNKKIASKENLPPTMWYDWVAGNVGSIGLRRLLRGKVGLVGTLVIDEVINPITVGGLRNVAKGMWEMRQTK